MDLDDKQGQLLIEYDEKKMKSLIARMPMSKWSGSSNGLVQFSGNVLSLNLGSIEERHQQILFNFTKEICEYRLHSYFERKSD